ncbi:MAG TPA: LytTR family DNA-binding domain-containing protein [Blastocatellia bacterium]|nr:LytTR family DNA-binding domain-containing protein [Blastocatellia bacterium]
MAMIRVMIIDDERPARQKIRHYLQSEPDMEIVGEASSGREAVESIQQNRPDLVFLDVQMPGLDGFGVLEALDFEPLPQIVFVTAHDHFALRAFEVHALDYLLKPFDPSRFEKVLDRARAFIKRGPDEGESVSKLLEELRGRPRYIERLLIHCEDRAFFLRVDQIQWIESAKNYVRLHVDKNVYSMRGTIEGLNKRLDPARFLRINRSQIVNLDSIKELQPWFHGEYRIILKDGSQMNWSRRYLDRSSDLFANRF